MRLVAAAAIVLFSTTASGQAPRPPQTFPMYLQAQYATLKNNVLGSAEKMPAEHFAFKPSPGPQLCGIIRPHHRGAIRVLQRR